MLTKNGIMFSYLDTSSAEIEVELAANPLHSVRIV